MGLIPGLGDAVTVLPAAYMIFEGYRLGVRPGILGRMALNSGADLLVGSIPLVGDAFDVVFKANRRNMALLRREIAGMEQAGIQPAKVSSPR